MKRNDKNDFEFIKDKFEKTYPATPDSLSEDAINQLLLSKQGVNAQNRKRVKFTKALLIAAIIVVILSIAIPVSAKYIYSDASDAIVQFFNDHFHIDLRAGNTNAINHSDDNDEIIKYLKEKGFDNVILPSELLSEDYEKTISLYDENEGFKTVEIDFTNKTNDMIGFIGITKYISEGSLSVIGQGDIPFEHDSVKQLSINGMDIIVFNKADYSFINYVDNDTEYEIQIDNCDFETAIGIAETLDYSNDILRELNSKGFDSVILPAELLNDKYEKSVARYEENEDFKQVEIDFKNNKNKIEGFLVIIKYISENSAIAIGQGVITEEDSVKQLTLNGMDVLVFSNGNDSFIDYVDNDTEYEIEINNCDFETAIGIAETLDYSNNILKELNSKGFDGIILPSELLKADYDKTITDFSEDDNFITVVIHFESVSSEINGEIDLTRHKTSQAGFAIGQFEVADKYDSVKQITVNGIDVLIFSDGKKSIIEYVDGNTEYDLGLGNCEFETAIKIAETLG